MYNYQCGIAKCRKRKSLKKRVVEPPCPACGHGMKECTRQRKAYTKKTNCTCHGVDGAKFGAEYPHRKGGLGCIHYKGPRDLELEDKMARGVATEVEEYEYNQGLEDRSET